MKLRRIVLLVAALMLALLVLSGVLISRYRPELRLMGCGHPKEFRFPLLPYATHCCQSARAVSDLKMFHIAQLLHESDTGTNATTLEELAEEFPAKWNRFGITLISEGTNWSARIAQQNTLAGHYLFTSAGRLHFNTTQPATTNDFVLHEGSR